jgi:hypothetical protein
MMRSRMWVAVVLVAAGSAACGDGDGVGVVEAELQVSPAEAQPGSFIEVRGVPAGTSGPGHWLEVGGHRTQLFRIEGDIAHAVVPLFTEGAAVWPAIPAGAVDVELWGPGGMIAAARGALTIRDIARAAGTAEAVAQDLARIASALSTIADAIPPEAGEAARFPFVIARSLDSLQHSKDYSLAAELAELEATTPQAQPLVDALLASSGVDRSIRELATRLDGIAAEFAAIGPVTDRVQASSEGAPPALAADANGLLSDELLSMMMQLAVYLRHATELQTTMGSELSGLLSLFAIADIKVDPVTKVLGGVAAIWTIEALVLNKFLVAALPSVMDSMTLTLQSASLSPGGTTVAQVVVHASNKPDPVTMGDLLSTFQTVAGLIVNADRLEGIALYIISKTSGLLQAYANENPLVTYDNAITDLWSMPPLSFSATVTQRKLVELTTGSAVVVEPLQDEVNWIARAEAEASTTIGVGPSVGIATIPVVAEWLATATGVNLILGAFGEDLQHSAPVEVHVEIADFDLTGNWTLIVDEVCTGPMSISHEDSSFEASGSVGGGVCPFSASGAGSGTVQGTSISFGLAFGSGSDESGTGLGTVHFEGTVTGGGDQINGTYDAENGLSGKWEAYRQ